MGRLQDVTPPYIRRRDRFEVTERIDYDGAVAHTAGRGGSARARGAPGAAGEDRCRVFRELLRQPGSRDPDAGDPRGGAARVFVSTSTETLPEIFEFERFSTTVANAVLSPLVSGYVQRLGIASRTAATAETC